MRQECRDYLESKWIYYEQALSNISLLSWTRSLACEHMWTSTRQLTVSYDLLEDKLGKYSSADER